MFTSIIYITVTVTMLVPPHTGASRRVPENPRVAMCSRALKFSWRMGRDRKMALN